MHSFALKNWGKYNLDRSGKPMLDCVKKELEEVSDISLIEYVSKGIKKEDINKEAHNECYYSLTPSRKEIFLEMKTELEQQGILSYKGGREY